MIAKNEHCTDDDNKRVRIISEKKKILQNTSAKAQEEVRLCFEQLSRVLRTRERQLLRQVEAVHNQQLSMLQTNWELVPSIPSLDVDLRKRENLEESILQFGELLSSDRKSITVSDAEPYKIEEYVEADRDHISFDKSIKIDNIEETFVEMTTICASVSDSPSESSFNASSDADITLENEVTVIMNHNYSESSDGPEADENSLEASTKHTNISVENIEKNSVENLLYSSDTPDYNGTAESMISNENSAENKDCIVPETIETTIVEKSDLVAKQDDETFVKEYSEKKDSGSTLEIFENNSDAPMNKKTQDSEEHPKQIQQWLQQILVETETEPTIHEIEQFAEISKSRFKEFQFPLET